MTVHLYLSSSGIFWCRPQHWSQESLSSGGTLVSKVTIPRRTSVEWECWAWPILCKHGLLGLQLCLSAHEQTSLSYTSFRFCESVPYLLCLILVRPKCVWYNSFHRMSCLLLISGSSVRTTQKQHAKSSHTPTIPIWGHYLPFQAICFVFTP